MADTTQGEGASTTAAGGPQDNAAPSTPTAPAAGEVKTPESTPKAAEGEGEKPAAEGKPAEKPAEIEIKLDLPQGFEVDEQSLAEFKAIAKDHGLSQDAATAVAALAAKREAARVEAFKAQVSAWGDEVKADKDLGNPENQALARKAVDTFGTPALKEALERTGLGNHPELVRLMLKVGKAISEDKLVPSGREGSKAPKSLEERLYPQQS